MPHVKHVRYTGTESIEIHNPTFKAQLERIFNTRYIFSYIRLQSISTIGEWSGTITLLGCPRAHAIL